LTLNIIVTLKSGLEVIKVIETSTIQKLAGWFPFRLLAFYSNYGAILYHLRDMAIYW